MKCADVIVVGAGIIGSACAWQLARRGLRVALVDDGRPGATAAGMGHLVCMDDNPAELALCAYSLRLWRELAAQMPEHCAWRGCGTLWLAEHDDELALAEQNSSGWPPQRRRVICSAPANCGDVSRSCVTAWPAGCTFPATALYTRRMWPAGW